MRRITATFGLVALVPVALMLIGEVITPAEAALRAAAVLAAVVILTWAVGLGLRMMAGSLEYDARRRARGPAPEGEERP